MSQNIMELIEDLRATAHAIEDQAGTLLEIAALVEEELKIEEVID